MPNTSLAHPHTAGPAQSFASCCASCYQNAECGCFSFLPGICLHERLCNRLVAVPNALGGLKNNDGPIMQLPNATCTVYEGRSWGDWGLALGWILLSSRACQLTPMPPRPSTTGQQCCNTCADTDGCVAWAWQANVKSCMLLQESGSTRPEQPPANPAYDVGCAHATLM